MSADPENTKEPFQSNQVKWGVCKRFKSTTTKYSNFVFLLQGTLLILSAHTEIHPSLQRLCSPWNFSLRWVWGWAQFQDGTCPDCVPLRNWWMLVPHSIPLSARHVRSINTCSLTILREVYHRMYHYWRSLITKSWRIANCTMPFWALYVNTMCTFEELECDLGSSRMKGIWPGPSFFLSKGVVDMQRRSKFGLREPRRITHLRMKLHFFISLFKSAFLFPSISPWLLYTSSSNYQYISQISHWIMERNSWTTSPLCFLTT